MLTHSDSIASLAEALAKAQGVVENAAKNAANPHFKSRYADLAEILNTVRPALSAHGLAVVQLPRYGDGVVTVDTLLTHSSGEWVRGESSAPVGKLDPQGVGSATTYLRRYALAALCGIAQEDDDAAGLPQRATEQRQESRPAAKASGNSAAASDKQVALIEGIMRSHVISDDERAGIARRIERGMSSKAASEAIDWLQTTVADRKAREVDQQRETVPAKDDDLNGLPF